MVSPAHLALLADFIRGDLDMQSRQACLWPQYAFDVIPIEFISSIYETFVTKRASQDGDFLHAAARGRFRARSRAALERLYGMGSKDP